MRWIERIIIIKFAALNKAHAVVNIDSEGLRKQQNLQFCVQVFSTDTEFGELIREEHKLGVLYCALTEVSLKKTLFQKEDITSQILDFTFLLP